MMTGRRAVPNLRIFELDRLDCELGIMVFRALVRILVWNTRYVSALTQVTD